MRMLKIGQVVDKVALSSAEIYRQIKAGEFPAAVKLCGLNGRASGWVEAEVDEYLARRVRESRGEHSSQPAA